MGIQPTELSGDCAFKGLDISYSDLNAPNPDEVSISIGDRSVDLFMDPALFPMSVDGKRINLVILYADNSEEMKVHLIDEDSNKHFYGIDRPVEASMETIGMTTGQKWEAFHYLVGRVLDGC